MREIKLLNEMIAPEAVERPREKTIRLSEQLRGGGSYHLEILNVPDDALAINVDKNFCNKRLLSDKAGICRRSDYIIVSEEKRIVLFIEMKQRLRLLSPENENEEMERMEMRVIGQLKGSLCVFEYCQSVAKVFFKRDNFLNYVQRFVALIKIGNANKKVWKPRGASNSSPENMLRVACRSSVEFNEICHPVF